MGTRVLAGREFSDRDTAASPLVVVINDAHGAQVLGRPRTRSAAASRWVNAWRTVVGIVENTVTEQVKEEPVPFVYLAFNQALSGKESIATDPAHLFVRARE